MFFIKFRIERNKSCWTIEKYINYQQEQHENNRKVKFAVNIDIEGWDVLKELSRVIPKQFLYCSEFDMLTYLKKPIKGVNVPQIYLKVISIICDE